MKRGYISCPKCGGTGIVTLDSGKKARCNFCYSSGEVPKEKTMQTNEEWFCRLSTKEKAKEMCVIMADMAEANDGVWDEEMIEAWLKEEHHE